MLPFSSSKGLNAAEKANKTSSEQSNGCAWAHPQVGIRGKGIVVEGEREGYEKGRHGTWEEDGGPRMAGGN